MAMVFIFNHSVTVTSLFCCWPGGGLPTACLQFQCSSYEVSYVLASCLEGPLPLEGFLRSKIDVTTAAGFPSISYSHRWLLLLSRWLTQIRHTGSWCQMPVVAYYLSVLDTELFSPRLFPYLQYYDCTCRKILSLVVTSSNCPQVFIGVQWSGLLCVKNVYKTGLLLYLCKLQCLEQLVALVWAGL